MSSEELVRLVMDLVGRPSCWDTAEDQRRLGEHIRHWFVNHHISAEIDELGNVLVNPGASVVLNGHIDVVPPAGQATFNPVIKGDKIIGRGTSDMKSGIAVSMAVMKDLYKECSQLGVVFQVFEESEYEKSGADVLCEKGVFDGAKFIIEAEPSVDLATGRPCVSIGSEGGLDWSAEITTDVSPHHAAYMHRASNAILVATRYITDLINDRDLTVTPEEFKRSYNAKGARTGKGPINVAKIAGGIQPTWTPNQCEVQFEKRLYPSESWTAFHEQLNEYSIHFGRLAGADIKLKTLWHADPFMLNPESKGYKFVANWTRAQQLELSISNGASDLNKIYNYLKARGHEVSGVHFGPGFLELAHTSDEYVLINDLERFYGYYVSLVRELFDGQGKSLLS